MEAYLDNSATTRCCEEAAQLVVKLLTEDYGKIIIGNIMLLVPGVAFVNALRDMIGGDMMSGILRVCESILLAVFLAAGSFMALMFLGGDRKSVV